MIRGRAATGDVAEKVETFPENKEQLKKKN